MPGSSLFRQAVLALAGNRLISRVVRRFGMRLGAGRFVAAESLEAALVKVREMNSEGLMVTLDYLGENAQDPQLAEEAARMAIRALEKIDESRLNATVSVKLSQLGLKLGYDEALKNLRKVVEAARKHRNFVRIDMEDSSLTEATVRMFERLVEVYGTSHIGIVIQSYLYRSERDVRRLAARGANVRIVKGAYREPDTIAFPDMRDVDANYLKLVRHLLRKRCYTAVATHDEAIIDTVKLFADQEGIERNRFEFQMLYGVAGSLQRRLVDEGYRVRVYTPFGREWYPYFSRRIAERPANMFFVLKSLFRR
ncbi:MAG: proline dehydrogenase [Paenibacillaceae bacterium]|jgi:proline dehydrogenase|nr:proline dehydrogenase [Paenibacillaceae bacterium]